MTSLSESAPEAGQLVRVRGQHWVVTDVRRSRLAEDELASVRLTDGTIVSLAGVTGSASPRLEPRFLDRVEESYSRNAAELIP